MLGGFVCCFPQFNTVLPILLSFSAGSELRSLQARTESTCLQQECDGWGAGCETLQVRKPCQARSRIRPLQRQPCDGKGTTGPTNRGIYCLRVGYHKREKRRPEPVLLSRALASTEKYLKSLHPLLRIIEGTINTWLVQLVHTPSAILQPVDSHPVFHPVYLLSPDFAGKAIQEENVCAVRCLNFSPFSFARFYTHLQVRSFLLPTIKNQDRKTISKALKWIS